MTTSKGYDSWVSVCPDCGKTRYTSRKRAKARARIVDPSVHWSIYSCGDYWHFGHMPYNVKKGKIGRNDFIRN